VNYELERLGTVMEPDPGDPREAWGVLNPAAARGDDGELYLFPRLVAEGNFSRIGLARVVFEGGVPVGVERLGVALEPEEPWESKGVEDPRITFVEELRLYLMTYTAYGPQGPRIAVASSPDLERWERHGLVSLGGELDAFDNKDAAFFPERVAGAFALLHRPANEERPGIWVSFGDLTSFSPHRRVASPEQPWEELKIGAGPPPIRTGEGWLLVYHGVSGRIAERADLQQNVRYCAGAMLLDHREVWRVLDRTSEPLLEPETGEERRGIVPNVVFPTAVDERPDGNWDVYYGMADSRIGVARLTRRSGAGQSARPRGTSTQP
jgi:beta-1,2-mannobiose phosphorylase / 1,2-beta-oligomannan phosphorylase